MKRPRSRPRICCDLHSGLVDALAAVTRHDPVRGPICLCRACAEAYDERRRRRALDRVVRLHTVPSSRIQILYQARHGSDVERIWRSTMSVIRSDFRMMLRADDIHDTTATRSGP